MKKKTIVICLFLSFFLPLQASLKEEIISNLEKIHNLTFNFKQTIEEKTEEGNCTIEYPKKIFCSYNNLNKKIMVSNGKSLVIKNKNINQYYIYSLKRTPLELILDKDYLISQIKNLNGRIIDNKYLNFTLLNKNNNTTFLFSTHDPAVIKFAKKIIILKDGMISSEKASSEEIEQFTHK